MIKNFHWGHGIALFLTCFVLILIVALVSSMRMNHDLVSADYYADDLAYQTRFDKESKQQAVDNLAVTYNKSENLVWLEFKEAENISGTIHFYRPSDQSHDFTKEIISDKMSISTAGLVKGMWQVKVDWVADGSAFYKQDVLIL